MIRASFVGAVTGLALACVSTQAYATCTPLPYNLTNGQPADATQVMGNFHGMLPARRLQPARLRA